MISGARSLKGAGVQTCRAHFLTVLQTDIERRHVKVAEGPCVLSARTRTAQSLCVGWSAPDSAWPGTGASFSHHLKVSPPQLQLTAVRDTGTRPALVTPGTQATPGAISDWDPLFFLMHS